MNWKTLVVALLPLGVVGVAHGDALDDYNAGAKAHGSGEYDEAIQLFTKAIASGELSKEHGAMASNSRGIAWYRKGNLARAMADFDEAVRLDPKNAEAYNSRGIAWSGKGDHDRAIADFSAAIRLDPRPNAYNNRGVVWMDIRNYDRAIADFGEAVRLNPEYADALRNLAEAKRAKQRAR